MIKANELRIGNWVNVIKIAPVKITADHIKSIAEGDADYSPIPLTREILEKAGFERYDRGWKIKDQFFLQIQEHGQWVNDEPITEIKYMVYKSAIGAIKEVKYLHDLQNLYFALTGNELEIEL